MGRATFPAAYLALLLGSVVAIPRMPRSPARRRALRYSGRRAATAAHAAGQAVDPTQKLTHVVEASTLWWFVRSIPEWAAEEMHFVAQTHWLDSMDCIREEDDPETQWRATATSKDIGNIKNALDVEIAERLRKDLMIPLYGRPPAHVATGTCRRVVRPGDVIGIYWAGDPGPASEKFYWRATVEEDGGYLYVASPDWPREPFHPREDWWVMLEQKSRKRRRGDDGLDDDDAQSSRVADAL